MFNLLKKYDNNREQNMPPDFIPQKQQGQKLFGPEPVIEPQWPLQGPEPVIEPQWQSQEPSKTSNLYRQVCVFVVRQWG